MANMKLYGHFLSAPYRTVESFCRLANISYEYVHVDVPEGEQRKPEFLAINPLGQIPAIVDGDFHLGESHAILIYLHSTYHASESLYPADLRKRAKVDQYLHWHHANARKMSWLVYGAEMAPRYGRTLPPNFVSENSDTTKKSLAIIEQWLTSSPFIAGDEMTIADLAAFQEVHQLHMMAYDLSEYPQVRAWTQRLLEVSAIRETVERCDPLIAQWTVDLESKMKGQSA